MNLRAIFATGLFLASASFGADAELLHHVMPNAKIIAGIDVARAKSSALGQSLLQQFHSNNDNFAKFTALTGFDPSRDLTEILLAAVDTRSNRSSTLVLARGNFDTDRLKAALLVNGMASTETVQGVDIFTKKGSQTNSLAFVNNGLAVAGDTVAVRAALERRASGGGLPSVTYAKVQDMSRENDIWMLTSLPVTEFAEKMPDSTPEQLNGMMRGDLFQSVEQAAMGVKFIAENLQLTLEAAARSEKDATAMADVARFLSGMVQLSRNRPDVAPLAQALDSMKLTTDAKNVKLTLSVPQADIEKMMQRSKLKARKKSI